MRVVALIVASLATAILALCVWGDDHPGSRYVVPLLLGLPVAAADCWREEDASKAADT